MRARYGLGLPETIRLFAKLTYNEVLLPPQSPLRSNPAHLYRVTCHAAVTKPVTQWTRVTNVRHQLKSAGGVYCLLWIRFNPLSRGESEEGDCCACIILKVF